MKCPRCQSSISAAPDPAGFMTCPGCGARLRSRSAPATVGALAARGGADPDRLPDGINPNSTLPPGTPLPRIPRPGSPEARAALAEGPGRPALVPRPPAADDALKVMRAPRDVARESADEAQRGLARNAATLDALMAEIREVRLLQEEILSTIRAGALQQGGERRPFDVADELGLPIPPVVRQRQRKTVLLIDDDPETLKATGDALDRAEIPFRTVSDGRAALAAIAEDKPDVIVLELDIAGLMAGKDVINMIKATMHWVSIPIVLYSRAPITSQREARTVHGADDFVSKQDGTELLLAKVVTMFRRG